jgi:hypothetical protein
LRFELTIKMYIKIQHNFDISNIGCFGGQLNKLLILLIILNMLHWGWEFN